MPIPSDESGSLGMNAYPGDADRRDRPTRSDRRGAAPTAKGARFAKGIKSFVETARDLKPTYSNPAV